MPNEDDNVLPEKDVQLAGQPHDNPQHAPSHATRPLHSKAEPRVKYVINTRYRNNNDGWLMVIVALSQSLRPGDRT